MLLRIMQIFITEIVKQNNIHFKISMFDVLLTTIISVLLKYN